MFPTTRLRRLRRGDSTFADVFVGVVRIGKHESHIGSVNVGTQCVRPVALPLQNGSGQQLCHFRKLKSSSIFSGLTLRRSLIGQPQHRIQEFRREPPKVGGEPLLGVLGLREFTDRSCHFRIGWLLRVASVRANQVTPTM